MDVLAAIKERRSIRRFTDKPIDKTILRDLVECGIMAPSGHNKQARHFLVVTEKGKINRLGEIATWAKFMINQAQACIVVFCDSNESSTLVEDGSAATENILLAATSYGLGSCWIAGYGMPYAGELENFLVAPDNLKLVSLIALGYSAVENSKAPPRKNIDDVIKWNSF